MVFANLFVNTIFFMYLCSVKIKKQYNYEKVIPVGIGYFIDQTVFV